MYLMFFLTLSFFFVALSTIDPCFNAKFSPVKDSHLSSSLYDNAEILAGSLSKFY